jgi:hypothetical protein
LVVLLQGCELRLSLVPRLGGLNNLLLDLRNLGLEIPLLLINPGLQVTLLALKAGLTRRKPVPGCSQRCDAGLKLSLLLREPIPLRLHASSRRLGRCLRVPGLLEAALGLGELCCPGGQLLRDTGHVLPRGGFLPSRLLELTTDTSQLLPLVGKGLLASRKLVLHGCQALLSLGQLVPEFCQLLLRGLQGLLDARQLSLDLLTCST